MRLVAAVTLALVLPSAALGARTDLRVTLWTKGVHTGHVRVWTLRCEPAAGSLPRPLAACRRLGRLASPFAPVPSGSVCSDIYGGPEVGIVTGALRGSPVHALFKRTDSCQTERWNRVGFLFPGVP